MALGRNPHRVHAVPQSQSDLPRARILVFDRRHVVGLEQLSAEEFGAYMEDFRRAAKATAGVCQPDLMNYASLGNVVPHLHWHLVPRYRSDPRWGGPSYTTTEAEMLDRA